MYKGYEICLSKVPALPFFGRITHKTQDKEPN
jgi:hypothetical protein